MTRPRDLDSSGRNVTLSFLIRLGKFKIEFRAIASPRLYEVGNTEGVDGDYVYLRVDVVQMFLRFKTSTCEMNVCRHL